MRALFVVLVTLVSTPVLAFEQLAHNNSFFELPFSDANQIAPLDFHFAVDWPGAGPMSYTLSGLVPADENREWIIDETNAASFGFDWPLLAEASLNAWPSVYVHPRPTSTIDTPLGTFTMSSCCTMSFNYLEPLRREYGVVADHLRLKIGLFRYWPPDGATVFEVHTWIVGSRAKTLPEPTTLGSALFVAAALSLIRRHHTPHPLRK